MLVVVIFCTRAVFIWVTQNQTNEGNCSGQPQRTQRIQRANQNLQQRDVAVKKCQKMSADESYLLLVLYLIGKDATLLSKSNVNY